MDTFASLQGRTYELGGISGAICALRAFRASDICTQQIRGIISELGTFNLSRIFSAYEKNSPKPETGESAKSVLSARLFQGYVQGYCETTRFVSSLPGKFPVIAWVYANPAAEDKRDIPATALRELSLIADISEISPAAETGAYPFADFLFVARTWDQDAYRFHIAVYELSTHNSPNIDSELNLSEPDDVYESLRRGKSLMSRLIKTRDFRVASDSLSLEISSDLNDYFRGLLSHDKIAKKLFQAAGYAGSFYRTVRDRIIPVFPFDKWVPGQGRIEFHIAAFTDRGRHFLHLREDERRVLKDMGEIYKGIRHLSAKSSQEETRRREREILKTHEAVLRNIRRNMPSQMREQMNALYQRVEETFSARAPLPDYLDCCFTEAVEGFCQTGIPPNLRDLEAWLGSDLSRNLGDANLKSMQDAHAELLKFVWENDDADIIVLSGTPGIGKTTALRNILSKYDRGYLLIYISPRLQVNTDLMEKFDPIPKNCQSSAINSQLICLTTNAALIRASDHGKVAVNCRCRNMPEDPKFRFLSPEDAEKLERGAVFSKTRTGYKRLEKGGVGEAGGYIDPGVFRTVMEAVYKLNIHHQFKQIIACVSTQSNRQLNRGDTTVSRNLRKIFGNSRESDLGSVEKFAKNIKEIIFFMDEVTGDRAGRQTVQEIIEFRKHAERLFKDADKPCPLRFRVVIADASLINASSVDTWLNKTKDQPDQILFTGDADTKGLNIEHSKIFGLPSVIINANAYPASSLSLIWRPVLDFYSQVLSRTRSRHSLSNAYSFLENRMLEKLAQELLSRRSRKPEEQVIVIIQNKKSVDCLKAHILGEAKKHKEILPDIICLHSDSPPSQKRDIVSQASDTEKQQKSRIAGISQKGDLADFILMTSSGTRGISFPNASKIICLIPTFSLENNFMEFLQGIYRGRGSGIGNRLHREIEIIIPQVFTLPPEDSLSLKIRQISDLFATLMIMRMSILTRIFGACDLFGKSVSCIPISGTMVQGALQTFMDSADSAIRALERAHKRDPGNTDIRFIKDNLRQIFKSEKVILHRDTRAPGLIISKDYRNRLLRQFAQDAGCGFDVIAQGDYIPEDCYTIGELLLQNLDNRGIREENKQWIDTHMADTRKRIRAICAKLDALAKDKDTPKAVWHAANTLLPALNLFTQETESDTESRTKGSNLNRWFVVPISAMNIDQFWKNQPEPERFKAEMKELLEDYFSAFLSRPRFVLPLWNDYEDTVPPWLLVRGPEIAQQLDAQFQTRYVVSSKSLALLNLMLLSRG